MATTRDSTQYKKLHTDKLVYKATELGGRVVPIPFAHTVVSGETGGASAGVQDLVNLCVIPNNSMVIGLAMAHEALGASAGSGVVLDIGDAADPDRFLVGLDVDAAGTIADTTKNLPFTGQNFKATADTVVRARWRTANPVVGKKIAGVFLTVPES